MVCHQQNDKSHFQVRKITFYAAEDNNGEVRRDEGLKKKNRETVKYQLGLIWDLNIYRFYGC